MKINLIVAHGKNGQIGLNNKLLWHIPEDFKKFKELTSGHTIIMGRNTFESLPGMLPNRHHVVITTNYLGLQDNLESAISLEDALHYADTNEVWIIGGARVYNEAIEKDLIDEYYLSEVDYDGEADTFINVNKINYDNFEIAEEEFHESYTNEKDKLIPAWTFRRWIRKG